jgi:hypothetical protein
MSDRDLLLQPKEPEEFKKPGKVVAMCPVCNKKLRKGDKMFLMVRLLALSGEDPMPIKPVVLCMGCGVFYFAPIELETIKQNIEKGENKMITLQ